MTMELHAHPFAAGIRRSTISRTVFYLVDEDGNTLDVLREDEAADVIADDDFELTL